MKKDSNISKIDMTLTSEYNEEEAQFIQKMADKQGKTPEEYQKYSALNSGRKRFKDKKINAGLVKLSEAVNTTEEHLKNKSITETINDLNNIKGLLEETQCLL